MRSYVPVQSFIFSHLCGITLTLNYSCSILPMLHFIIIQFPQEKGVRVEVYIYYQCELLSVNFSTPVKLLDSYPQKTSTRKSEFIKAGLFEFLKSLE